MTDDQRPVQGRRTVAALICALAAGAAFGAATALVNALGFHYADFESRTATTSGWSPIEIVSVLLDSGWAWAGLGVFAGWLVTRAEDGPAGAATIARASAAAVLALLAATETYAVVEAIQDDAAMSTWFQIDPVWSVAGVVFGCPLGAVGACITRPGPIGLVARVIVPVGAAVQMAVLPPGRNEVIASIGQAIVWPAATVAIGLTVAHYALTRRRRPHLTDAQ